MRSLAGVLAALLIGGFAAYSIGSVAVGSATYRDGKETYTIKEMREELRGLGGLLGGLF